MKEKEENKMYEKMFEKNGRKRKQINRKENNKEERRQQTFPRHSIPLYAKQRERERERSVLAFITIYLRSKKAFSQKYHFSCLSFFIFYFFFI